MKNIYGIICLLICCLGCYNPISKNLQSASNFQKELYAYYNNEATTPLKADDKATFKGIHFFPLDEAYITTAQFIPAAGGDIIDFPTSAKKVKQFKEYGTINFEIKGQSGTLTLYQMHGLEDPQADGTIFLPFKDATSGTSSYGAGRYIDLSPKDIIDGKIVIDFNKAYNPYCAYSIHYNCPLTPANNILSFPIEAGVKYE